MPVSRLTIEAGLDRSAAIEETDNPDRDDIFVFVTKSCFEQAIVPQVRAMLKSLFKEKTPYD